VAKLLTPTGLAGRSGLVRRGGRAKKIVGGLKGSEGKTRIGVEGGVLLWGESSQKL